ncbi:MAG: Gfo/Idh/MocA family oxidoreductase [Chloroflexota bacterium]
MSNTPIRVGVIGAGGNTIRHHIPKLQAQEGVEVVSVCNRSRESSERVAKQFNIPTVYDDWQALVNADDTNAIVIGTWPYMHCPITLATLAADKHVMCEARMAMNASQAHAMRDASRTKPHLIAQIVPSPMSLGVDTTVRRLIAEGYLGDIVAINTVAHTGNFAEKTGELGWRHNMVYSGLNIMGMGIWYEALLRWVGEATQVMAMGKTVTKMRKNADGNLEGVKIPDHIDIVATMACGAQAHFQISAVTGIDKYSGITLFGTEGTLQFTQGKLFGGQKGDDALSEIAIPDDEKAEWRVEEEFVGAIRGLEPIRLTDFDTGVKYMEFTEAVTRSMTSQQVVSLPLL